MEKISCYKPLNHLGSRQPISIECKKFQPENVTACKKIGRDSGDTSAANSYAVEPALWAAVESCHTLSLTHYAMLQIVQLRGLGDLSILPQLVRSNLLNECFHLNFVYFLFNYSRLTFFPPN